MSDTGIETEHFAHLRADRDRFLGPRMHAPALGDQGGVVVGPTRPRQFEQSLAFGERNCRVRIGVQEDVSVVEGRHQPDLLRKQHAVAEHVAAHVTDAYDCERLGLGVDADLPEVTLNGLPRPTRGDAHLLVVVPGRTT